MNQAIKGKKVFVGMSGGVDSSVTAALLKKQGYDVTGVFIKVWQPDWISCTWREDRLDAMRVCAKLEIPFFTLDLEKEYKEEVVDYMIREYKAGRTPNPDVMCNKWVKFGGFLKWALAEGADYVATGHYAQNIDGVLTVSDDSNKDQSYFLWTLRPDQLKHILFPIGHLEKPNLRKLAKKFGLPNAEKKDSQGLCFIGKIDFREFLSHYLDTKPGNVIDEKGEIIGTHDGAYFYTIGQRHGFELSNNDTARKMLYVISKNIEHNTLTVSPRDPNSTETFTLKSVVLSQVNWTKGVPPQNGAKIQVRARYRQPLEDATVTYDTRKGNESAKITFDKSQVAITPGQSLVMYDGKACLGGGIIA